MVVVTRRQPDARPCSKRTLIDLYTAIARSQSVESQHALQRVPELSAQRGIAIERAHGLIRDERRERVHVAWPARRKHPLDEVMHGFELLVAPGENCLKCATVAVLAAVVEVDDGVRRTHQYTAYGFRKQTRVTK